MPIYGYECKKCGEIELWHMHSETKEECPLCKGPIKRVYGTFGVKFKGPGFYSNDSKGEK